MRDAKCGLCGNKATGLASINGQRYCHGDADTEPTCYEKAQWGPVRDTPQETTGDDLLALGVIK